MEDAQKDGKIRSIGVSNMSPKIWNQFVPQFEVKPSVNQVEFNPYFQQKNCGNFSRKRKRLFESYGPLGHGNAELLRDPAITKIAAAHGKNSGQVILRFEIQEGGHHLS